MRIVADTNTLVSGFGWGGPPGQVVDTVLSGQVILVISPALLGELARVLAYPKLAAVFDHPAVLVAAVAEAADTVDPAEHVTVLVHPDREPASPATGATVAAAGRARPARAEGRGVAAAIGLEIVSADSITTDIQDKRAEYAAAGIPHYWIVRMTDNDGPAISVERLLLTSDGEYAREGLAIRGRDFHAIDSISPFPLRLSWEALDEGL